VAIGSEITIRIGNAAGTGFLERGFHPTGICGLFGAVGAAARLQRLDIRQTVNALGIAGSMAAGIFEFLADGSATKPIHAGWAAHAGILATRLAAHGAEGPATVLEGRFGLFRTHGVDLTCLENELAELGRGWEGPRTSFKRFPACHLMHCALDATASVMAETALSHTDIARVLVSIPEQGIPIVAIPREAKLAPRTAYEAKFSLPYSLAALAVHGRLDLSAYLLPALEDERVLQLARRVEVQGKRYPTYPEDYPGAIRMETHDGHVYFREQLTERCMSEQEVVEKFSRNASLGLNPDSINRLVTWLTGTDAVVEAEMIGAELRKATRNLRELRVSSVPSPS
jgi:2-methylcitrate dehydratase PrpD